MSNCDQFPEARMKNDNRRVRPKSIYWFQALSPTDFATKRSHNLFTALNLDSNFLWNRSSNVEHTRRLHLLKEKVSALCVVNDCAERVKPASDFNIALTKDEGQRLLLFQVIEHHWKLMSLSLKRISQAIDFLTSQSLLFAASWSNYL